MSYISIFNNNKLLYQHIKTENSSSLDLNAHSHVTYEILYILKGDVSLISEGRRYRLLKNDLILIPSRNFHRIVFESDCEYDRCNLALTSSVAKSVRFSLANPSKETVLFRLSNANEIDDTFQKLDYYCKHLSEDAFFDVAQALIKQLFYFLNLNQQYVRQPEDTHYSPLLISVLNYINENLFTIKSLKEISDRLFITEAYLFKLFKNQLKISPKKYINSKRLLHAQKLIRRGKKPTDIYSECGFDTYVGFYKQYVKHFGFAPSKEGEAAPKET